MIRPLVLVHPPKQHIQQLDQGLLLQRVLCSILLQFPHDVVADIDNVPRFFALPVTAVVVGVD